MKKVKYSIFSMQLKSALRSKSAMTAFYITLVFVLVNAAMNILTYQSTDLLFMKQPMQLLLLSDESGIPSYIFIQLYPLLVALPAGFTLVNDYQSQEMLLQVSRSGVKPYFRSRLKTAFFATAIVFMVPLMLDILLNCLFFPLDAVGQVSFDMYTPDGIAEIRTYLWYSLFVSHPYLYAVFMTVWFGVVSGVLGMFTIAVSSFGFKYKVFVFLPAWFLLNFFGWLKVLFPSIPIDTMYSLYLQMYDAGSKSEIAALLVVAFMAVLSILIMERKRKKDVL